jgi:hypothetical protein
MTDAADELAHVIRKLINEAVARGLGLRDLDRPNLTEQELFEYLHNSEALSVNLE